MVYEYYGHNDWRDYHLSHHGVLGMHWGIRRYQPYGIGYQRKDGEGGKFMGEVSSKIKAHNEKVVANYKAREANRNDFKYDSYNERLNRKKQKMLTKYDRALYQENENKLSKLESKISKIDSKKVYE